MKKFSKINWNLYKNSDEGKKTISRFREAMECSCDGTQLLELAKIYDERLFMNGCEEEYIVHNLDEIKNLLSQAIDDNERKNIIESEEEKRTFYKWFLAFGVGNEDDNFDDIPQRCFKWSLYLNIITTWALWQFMPQAFIPNLFAMQFHYLARFCHDYEIELPRVPNRSAYKDRSLYYIELNKVLLDYAHENDITTPEEVCAFWFGYALILAKEEIEAGRHNLPKTPEQAWLLVGNYGEDEKNMESGFWQANPMTKRGDVMVFYEKSPIKAVNAIWIAMDDGVADPFFHYLGYSWIGHKIEIPKDMALTYNDFKGNEYFRNRDTKGNFVSKNFQDCSGWVVTFDDYAEIKRMLKVKGYDISLLPSLYEPNELSMEDIHCENDVYEKLLTPMLEQMGWTEGKDFQREVEFAAGHSTMGHAMNKRPDYCLHMKTVGKKVYAKVVIEAKYYMKNIEELSQTFDQCLSYASWGQAKVLMLVDKYSIYVYEQNINGQFEFDKCCCRYRWEQLSEPEVYKELKRKLS